MSALLWHQPDLQAVNSILLDKDLCKQKIMQFPYFNFFSDFQSWFCHIHWFHPCRSFKHSNSWCHKL